MQLDGAWADAVAAARQACDHLSGPVTWDTLGSAYYQLGELQRLRGEFAEAEESYRRASESGRPPEPGLALLRLAQGRTDVAAGVLSRALTETDEPPTRSRLLPAYVETMIASGDVASASVSADELRQIAEFMDAPYLHAVAASAEGAVLLAEGDVRSALRTLRTAGAAWRELNAPYETARTRVLIGLACAASRHREGPRSVREDRRTSRQQHLRQDRSAVSCGGHGVRVREPPGLVPGYTELPTPPGRVLGRSTEAVRSLSA
jgi:tetratricopeptide (TPR) repeat protein